MSPRSKKIVKWCAIGCGIAVAAWIAVQIVMGITMFSFNSVTSVDSGGSKGTSYTSGRSGGIGWNADSMLNSTSSGAGSTGGNHYMGVSTDEALDSAPTAAQSSSTVQATDKNQQPETVEDTVAETGFVKVSDEPTSTMSADVDTASYCAMRKSLSQTGRSYLETARVEEMLNYFHYDYPTPTGDDKFAIASELSACPWNPESELLTLGFAAADEDPLGTQASNIVFLVDVSGSMSDDDKLALFKDGFAQTVKNFGPDDRISMVTYASGEAVVLSGCPGDDAETILTAIQGLSAGGSTNGEAGLRRAYEQAHANFIPGGSNRIVMATDGDLNVGMTSTDEFKKYVGEEKDQGIYLSILGFGNSYNDELLEAIADNGNGNYHYIDCIEEYERIFSKNLTKNLVPFANDVKVQLDFNPDLVESYRLVGYENRRLANEDFTNDAKDAGDVGPGSQFTVCYEIKRASQNTGNIADVAVRYKPVSQGVAAENSVEQKDTVKANGYFASPSDNQKFVAAVVETAQVVNGSAYKGGSSYKNALALLDQLQLDNQKRGFKQVVEALDQKFPS